MKHAKQTLFSVLLCSFNAPRSADLGFAMRDLCWVRHCCELGLHFTVSPGAFLWAHEVPENCCKLFFFFNLMKQHLKLNSCSFLFQIISGSEIPLINILTLQGYKKSCVISVPTSYFPSLGILIRFNTEWIEIFTLPLLNT